MFKKIIDKIWQLKMPKKYRNYTDEELGEEYEVMRMELAALSENPDNDGQMFLDFLEKNEDLIYAMEILQRRRFEEFLASRK